MTTDLDSARPGADLVERLANPAPEEAAAVDARSSMGIDMVVRNRGSRYHLVMDALDNGGRTPPGASDLEAWGQAKLAQPESSVVEHLEDLPEVRDWVLGAWAEQG